MRIAIRLSPKLTRVIIKINIEAPRTSVLFINSLLSYEFTPFCVLLWVFLILGYCGKYCLTCTGWSVRRFNEPNPPNRIWAKSLICFYLFILKAKSKIWRCSNSLLNIQNITYSAWFIPDCWAPLFRDAFGKASRTTGKPPDYQKTLHFLASRAEPM